MNKEEIIRRLMLKENWETLYMEYTYKGLKTEKKEKLLKMLKESE